MTTIKDLQLLNKVLSKMSLYWRLEVIRREAELALLRDERPKDGR